MWPNHCSHTGKWLPLSPFCTLLHHLCPTSGIASCHKQMYTRLPVMMAQMSCYASRITVRSQQNIRACDRHNNQTALLLFSRHLTFIHHPSFLPSLPDSPLIEIYYPATGPQDDHTIPYQTIPYPVPSVRTTIRYVRAAMVTPITLVCKLFVMWGMCHPESFSTW